MRRKFLFLIGIPIIASIVGVGLIPAFAKAPMEWAQVNESGFGNEDGVSNDGVLALERFKGDLYAGTTNYLDYTEGASVWRWDGDQWTRVSDYGFDSETSNNSAVTDLVTFHGMLYAGTTDWAGMSLTGQIWRTADGMIWQPVETAGFGNLDNHGVTTFTVYDDMLYAATGNDSGLEIWRSSSGDPESWDQVVEEGFSDHSNRQVTGFVEFKGALYVAIETPSLGDPAQVWRTVNGTIWTQVVSDGFDDSGNWSTGAFASFQGYLYLGTRNPEGGQVWRSKDGTDWTQVIDDGFDGPANIKVESLYVFKGQLYAVTYNDQTGVEVWRSADGADWTQANSDGFDDFCNWSTLWSNATLAFKGSLFIGTWNNCEGGEIWQLSK